ncbi:sarcosine oxidase, putative [Pseudomonas orientalis]|uniref:N-methyl-L-tryptophan oxidase n=1 Tax=Pseudomonas orientalis TaxID=76758 RepID=UPI000F55A657|nr:N-methyl-L-tryptophan oxidase [Pseudomonas orientalis]AZE94187.1 sarcosine oxidase, putative [Pseudomonas orientalis]AZE99631.1 sarcosine oxidase, putative [Pseudomonas orientalis]
MRNTYDVIVIGLGITGAAALWRVAAKCTRTLGIEASGPTHSYGSSHGNSRIFRRAYWEGGHYLPLLNQSDLLWNELEQATQKKLLFRTGGIFVGPQSSHVVAGSIETARGGGIEHAVWSEVKTRSHFAAFNVPTGSRTVFEPGAYAISACEARLEMLNEAVRQGAIIEFGDSVVDMGPHGSKIRLRTRNGQTHFAKKVIVTAGPWIAIHLLPELESCIEPRQIPVFWFKPKKGFEHLFSSDQFPIFLYEHQNGALLYGLPSILSNEPGVKIGFHNRQQTPATPEWANIPVQKIYLEEISEVVSDLFPKLERSPIYAKNCFYTLSPDDSFLIGESRALRSTYFASACSGHGFKFAPAIGDALASMAVGQQPHVSLAAFSAERFY